jgi:hypothetical protein
VTLDDLRQNRNLLFWGLHTLGWSGYLITQYLGALLYEKPGGYMAVIAIAALAGFVSRPRCAISFAGSGTGAWS